jgi:hypothetical protein
MAPNTRTDNRPSKKQKTASGARGVEKRKANGTSPHKKNRKRLALRTSSGRSIGSSSQDDTHSKTPVFRQPQRGHRPSSRSSDRASGSTRNPAAGTQPSQAQNVRRAAKRPAVSNDSDDDEEEEEEEEQVIGGALKEGLTKYMQQLPQTQRYTALGKAFALKYWPWPSLNWWIDNNDYGGVESENGRSACEMQVESSFSSYLDTVEINESDRMTSLFKTSVTVSLHTFWTRV